MSYIKDPMLLARYMSEGHLPEDYWLTTTVDRAIGFALTLRGHARFAAYMSDFHREFTLEQIVSGLQFYGPHAVDTVLKPKMRVDKFEHWMHELEPLRIGGDLTPMQMHLRIVCLRYASETAKPGDYKTLVAYLRTMVSEDDVPGSEAETMLRDVLRKMQQLAGTDFNSLIDLLKETPPWMVKADLVRAALNAASRAGDCELVAEYAQGPLCESQHAQAVEKFFQLSSAK